jgi:hypothetical protein
MGQSLTRADLDRQAKSCVAETLGFCDSPEAVGELGGFLRAARSTSDLLAAIDGLRSLTGGSPTVRERAGLLVDCFSSGDEAVVVHAAVALACVAQASDPQRGAFLQRDQRARVLGTLEVLLRDPRPTPDRLTTGRLESLRLRLLKDE